MEGRSRGRRAAPRGTVCLVALAGFASASLATGPEWVEDDDGRADAGTTPTDAQTTVGQGPLTKIRGKLDGLEALALGEDGLPDDFDDVYLIRIDDPSLFAATTAIGGGFSEFDSSLYLFDAAGFGLLGNVTPGDPPAGSGGEGDGATLGNAATDPTGVVVDEPGLYLLAVTLTPRTPFSGSGQMFVFAQSGEVSGPDGKGAGGALAEWNGSSSLHAGPGGDYEILLQGVTFALTPGACCFSDGGCLDLVADDCAAAGGAHQGDGSACAAIACPLPVRVGGGSDKGSLLCWSAVEVRWDHAGQIVRDTFLTIGNDYPGDVEVQLYFINGDDPLPPHPGWNWVDNVIALTQNEPAYWSAATGLPKGVSPLSVLDPGPPPGRLVGDGSGDRRVRGYVLGWAVDADQGEIRWNHLHGSATVVDYRDRAAWSYEAWSFPVVDETVAHGAATGSPGELRLDGSEYAAAPSLLLLDFYADGAMSFSGGDPFQIITSRTILTLHPLSADLRQETAGPVCTKADMSIWNTNEFKFSGTHLCVCCWDQTALADYAAPNNFVIGALQSSKGRVRIDGVASIQCADGPTPSRFAAMLGVAVRELDFQFDLAREASAVTLAGSGIEAAVIRYDVVGPPPEAVGPLREQSSVVNSPR
jgi:hypothetical protein